MCLGFSSLEEMSWWTIATCTSGSPEDSECRWNKQCYLAGFLFLCSVSSIHISFCFWLKMGWRQNWQLWDLCVFPRIKHYLCASLGVSTQHCLCLSFLLLAMVLLPKPLRRLLILRCLQNTDKLGFVCRQHTKQMRITQYALCCQDVLLGVYPGLVYDCHMWTSKRCT